MPVVWARINKTWSDFKFKLPFRMHLVKGSIKKGKLPITDCSSIKAGGSWNRSLASK